MNDADLTKIFISGAINFMFMVVGSGIIGFFIWLIRRWMTRVEDKSDKAVTTEKCKEEMSRVIRDDEDFRQEIRDGFTGLKVDIRDFKKEMKDDVKEFKKDVKADFRAVHSRVDGLYDSKPKAIAAESLGS